MKLRYRAALCASLLLAAGLCTASAIEEHGRQSAVEAVSAADSYILRSSEGCVAVFSAADGEAVCATGIEVALLPGADRAGLETGIPAESWEDVLLLLEDLGS